MSRQPDVMKVRDPDRVDRITTLLYRYWRKNPDLRLGQIVGNIAATARRDPYYIEDDEVEAELLDWIDRGYSLE